MIFHKLDEPPKRILWAAENNHLSIVQQLLAMDPSLVNARDRDQYTPLHRAAYGDHVEIAEVNIYFHLTRRLKC